MTLEIPTGVESRQEVQPTMFGLVKVLSDAHEQTLVFASKPYAQQFVDFVHTYMNEMGPGNGYGAYWHGLKEPVVGIDSVPGGVSTELNVKLILDMARSICHRRNVAPGYPVDGSMPDYVPSLGKQDGKIFFEFNPERLPPRRVPTVGDLVRVVDHPEFRTFDARVQTIDDQVAIILPTASYKEVSSPLTVPVSELMKIYDHDRENVR